MSYSNAPLSAIEEARLFIRRLEAIEGLNIFGGEIERTVEQAVDACPRPFFEVVRLTMVQVKDVSAKDYKILDEVKDRYCVGLPADVDEQAAMTADVSERAHHLLAAFIESIEHEFKKEPSPQDVLSVLMLIVWMCKCVHDQQDFGVLDYLDGQGVGR